MMTRRLCVLMLVLGLPLCAQEKPRKALQDAIKATLKADSYRLEASVVGGFAEGSEHTLTRTEVDQSYVATVMGKLTHIEAPIEAYRVLGGKSGALREGDGWVPLNSTDASRQLNRLLEPLPSVLGQIHKLRKLARWVESDGRSGHLRIEAPASIATEAFLAVQSSGCFDEQPAEEQTAGGGSSGGGSSGGSDCPT